MKFELERSKAQFGVGDRRQVFRTELERFRTHYQHPTPDYVMFEGLVCACALLLPPQRFYKLLDWYGRNNFKRFRTMLGKAKVPPAFFQQRPVSERDL
jgi:hypothetical protein